MKIVLYFVYFAFSLDTNFIHTHMEAAIYYYYLICFLSLFTIVLLLLIY